MSDDAAESTYAPVRHREQVLRAADAIFLAAPFGFGPLSKALNLAAVLQGDGWRVAILADAGGAAIARGLGYKATSYAYRELLDLTSCDARVVVSCLDISTPLRRSDIPLVIVDTLHWMRGTWEREYTGPADLYIAQRFNGKAIPPSDEVGPAITVDAILGKEFVSHIPVDSPEEAAVIYPGGLGSPYLSDAYRHLYVEWIMTGFIDAARTAKFDVTSSILVLPDVEISTPSMRLFARQGGTIVSDFAKLPDLLRRAGHAVIAPGIEISLESAAVGRLPLFLPAFNGSHVAQVPTLIELEFGAAAVPTHVDEIESRCKPEQNLRATTASVQAFNSQHLSVPRYREEFHNSLVAELSTKPKQLRPRYPLGWDGAGQAITLIRGLLS